MMQLLRCAADVCCVEHRTFEQRDLCIFGDFGIQSAHDACDADALMRVGQ